MNALLYLLKVYHLILFLKNFIEVELIYNVV